MTLEINKKYKGLSSEQIKQIESSSWGASLNWIYLLAMHAYWQAIVYIIVMFIPVFNIVAWILVIFIGKKLAWENRYWTSFENYATVQKAWNKGAKIYYTALVGILIISLTVAGISAILGSSGSTTPSNFSTQQIIGLNKPITVDAYTIVTAKDFRKVNSSEVAKYKAQTDCSGPENCEVNYGYSIYAITLNFRNTGPKDYSLNKNWITIEEDPSANSDYNIPNTYPLYFEELNNHDIYQNFIIPSGGERDVILPFRLQDERTKITLLMKLFTGLETRIILSLPK